MSHAESAQPIVAPTGRSRRAWLPVAAIVVALVAIGAIWLLAPEQLERPADRAGGGRSPRSIRQSN